MSVRLITVVLLLSAAGPARAQSQFRFHEPVQPPRAVQVIAHRGLMMLAPENSIAAVQECGGDFIEWAEIDVRITQDGQHVIIHDKTVDETATGHGRVADLTLAELQRFDSGAGFAPRFANTRPATLKEMLDAAKGRVNLLLDCKHIDPATLVHDVQAAGMESQVIVFGDADVLRSVRQAAGSTLAILAKFDPRETSIQALTQQIDPAAVEIDARDVTPELCREIHALGIKVLANALGTEADIPAVWTDLIVAEVDWIQTDNPVGLRFCEVRRRIPQFPVQFACHRGANRYAPENTVPAIRTAADIGADYIEIDIRTTQDGAFVLVHDRTLDRTTNGTGPVSEQTSAAIAALDAGAWFGAPFAGLRVPSLNEGLVALGPHAQVYLDAKDIAPESLLAAIRAHHLMSRHAVYQSVEYCRRLKALDADVRLQPPLRSPDDLDAVAELSPYCVDASWAILSQELIDRCHARGILVFSDALGPHETLADYRRAIGWGIDLIQTDYPLRVLRAIELEAAQ